MVGCARGGVSSPTLRSWADLAELSDKAAENPDDYWEWVGFEKKIKLYGFIVPTRVSHVQTGYGFVFEILAGKNVKMNEAGTLTGGWRDSDLRQTLNGGFITELPEDLQAVLKSVDVNTFLELNGNDLETTQDKIWLPALSQLQEQQNSTLKKEGDAFLIYRRLASPGISVTVSRDLFVRARITDNGYANSTTYDQWWSRSLAQESNVNGYRVFPVKGTTPNITNDVAIPNKPNVFACPCFCITAKPQ